MKQVLYRVEEVCVMTGLGPTKVYAEIQSGRLGHVIVSRSGKSGKAIRIPAEAITAWIDLARVDAGMEVP